ncbi:response regulator [Pseudomonas sp. GV071]|uniref:hybrid sensor histidine kinase/response regulator n=1 Tax=Pseudomonas sp. GV071 TaxID=2135754 RepID=UPI000D352DBA|nr:response regulator [Pseudomonas sp. GV071]PTQ68159.1 signal transduction histidine kinase [Pseudomonas sp. GV071]
MPRTPRYPLRQWIWRAFLQSALIPLVLVESVLIAVYLLTNTAIRDTQLDYLQQRAAQDLTGTVQREGEIIGRRLEGLESQAKVYQAATTRALSDMTYHADALERSRYSITPDGVHYTHRDDGRAASFYSNVTPVDKQDHAKALRLSRVDVLMRWIRDANPLVSALYFNGWDSYNRIYPFFMTPDRYAHDMVIPDYNFYYLADAKHNPERKVVWTDVYLDPAGQGWMMSAVAPVYRDNFLEGVVGLDVTVGQMVSEIGNLQVPWHGYAVLVSRDQRVIALPAAGEQDFGLNELTEYSYAEAVRREVLKPNDFDLKDRRDLQPLLQAMTASRSDVKEVLLGGRKQLVAWSEIPQTGWRLLVVVDEANIFQATKNLAERYQQIGYLLIAGLLFFYLLFFAWMWRRSRLLTAKLAKPMADVVDMMGELGKGNFKPQPVDIEIDELAYMADAAQQTGQQLLASEDERHKAQSQLELVLESTTESLWEVEARSMTITVRGRGVKRYGLNIQCLTFAEFNQRVHPDDLDRLRQLRFGFADSSEDTFEAQYRFADADGHYVWLLSRGKVLERDAKGRAMRVAGTHVDISSLKQVQEDLRRTSLEAQEASQAKSRFLSSMSHELRTPLNAIYGFAQLIELDAQEQPGSEQQADYAREIVNASRHLTALVEDILDLSSIESRRQQLQFSSVDVAELLRSCAELVQPEASQRGQQLQVLAAEQPGMYVWADVRRVRQVLLNLLSNAIKYNSPQGMVSLGYEVRPTGIRLWVQDTGPGLNDEQQALLFQPFQRLGWENSTIPGAGIGLVLSRELAELMDGELGLLSTPGIGSRFWIDLPSAAAPDSSAAALAPAAEESKELAAVLCVEDHPACMRVLQEGLREMADVRGAASIQRAYALLESFTPDLVLLDLDLPDGDGLHILDMLRRTPHLSDVPVLVVSAAADEDVFADAVRRGAQACLAKPIDLQQLRRLAMELLVDVVVIDQE